MSHQQGFGDASGAPGHEAPVPSPLKGSATLGQQGPPRASGAVTRSVSALMKSEEPPTHMHAGSHTTSGDSGAHAALFPHQQPPQQQPQQQSQQPQQQLQQPQPMQQQQQQQQQPTQQQQLQELQRELEQLRLEKQARLAQEAQALQFRQQLLKPQQQQPQQQQQQQPYPQPYPQPHPHPLQQQQPFSQQQQQRAPPQVRMSAVQPGELAYHKASEGTALADWLFKLEQLLSQLGVGSGEFGERIRIAAMHWDRQTNVWWEGHVRQAAGAGAPITDWPSFVTALKANFVPTNDAEAAASDLLRLRMRGGESMDAYLQRAALLLARADGRLPDAAAARSALDGVDSSRFPFTVAAARKAMRTAVSPLSFHALRAELTALAVDEPALGGRLGGLAGSSGRGGSAPGGVTGASASSSRQGAAAAGRGGGSSSSMTRKQLLQRINALESGHYAYDDEEDADEAADDGNTAVHTAPVSAKRSAGRQAAASRPTSDSSSSGSHRQRRCFKCDSPDHGVRECTSKKELRSCLACHERGHLVATCPRVQRGGGSGEEGAPRPKNE